MTEIYLHIVARTADYMATHPYAVRRGGAAYHVRSAQIQLRLMIHRASRSMPNSQEYNILNSEEERLVTDTQRTFSIYI